MYVLPYRVTVSFMFEYLFPCRNTVVFHRTVVVQCQWIKAAHHYHWNMCAFEVHICLVLEVTAILVRSKWNLDNKEKKETIDVKQGGGYLQQQTCCHGWHLIKGERVCSALSADINQKVTVHKGYITYESEHGYALLVQHWSKRLWRLGHLFVVMSTLQIIWHDQTPTEHSSTWIVICRLEISQGMSQKYQTRGTYLHIHHVVNASIYHPAYWSKCCPLQL